jgi:hypothetical protein
MWYTANLKKSCCFGSNAICSEWNYLLVKLSKENGSDPELKWNG